MMKQFIRRQEYEAEVEQRDVAVTELSVAILAIWSDFSP